MNDKVIRFNKPEDGNFWLTNFYKGEPINSLLPTKIDNNGKIAEDSDYFTIDGGKGREGDEPFKFASAEHLFQALKFAWQNPDWAMDTRKQIKNELRIKVQLKEYSGENARYFAETDPTRIGGEIRRDWDTYKLNAMKYVIRQKFTQNPELKQRLMDTGYETLIVDNNFLLDETEDDNFWGVTHYIDERSYVGRNHLGKILMEIRKELQKKEGWTEREESGDSSGSSERPTTFYIDQELARLFSRDLLRRGLIHQTQQERLTEINSSSDWLIFPSGSLNLNWVNKNVTGNIISKELKKIIKFAAEEIGETVPDLENFQINFQSDGKVAWKINDSWGEGEWIAISKKGFISGYLPDLVNIFSGDNNRKKDRYLTHLLADKEITKTVNNAKKTTRIEREDENTQENITIEVAEVEVPISINSTYVWEDSVETRKREGWKLINGKSKRGRGSDANYFETTMRDGWMHLMKKVTLANDLIIKLASPITIQDEEISTIKISRFGGDGTSIFRVDNDGNVYSNNDLGRLLLEAEAEKKYLTFHGVNFTDAELSTIVDPITIDFYNANPDAKFIILDTKKLERTEGRFEGSDKGYKVPAKLKEIINDSLEEGWESEPTAWEPMIMISSGDQEGYLVFDVAEIKKYLTSSGYLDDKVFNLDGTYKLRKINEVGKDIFGGKVLSIGMSYEKISEATAEEIRKSKGDGYRKREIVDEIKKVVNDINNIDGIKRGHEIREVEEWERQITDAPNLEEAERIKNEVHEAILIHIRDVLRTFRTDSNLSPDDLELENRFYRADDHEGRDRNDALSVIRNPELENVVATTQRIVADILAKKLSEEEAEFINKFKDAQGGREAMEAMEAITNQEILAYKEKGWDDENSRRIHNAGWEARDLKVKAEGDTIPIAIIEGKESKIFVGDRELFKHLFYLGRISQQLPEEDKRRLLALNNEEKTALIKPWLKKHFSPQLIINAHFKNGWEAEDVKDMLDENREIAGKASLSGEEGSYIFDPLIVKKERVVAQDGEWRELFPDAAERYKWQSSLILTPGKANYLGRERKWEPNDIRPLFNPIYIYIMSDGREVRSGDPDYEVVNRTRRLGDTTVRETIRTGEQQVGVEVFLPHSSTILFDNKKEWRNEIETMPKKVIFYARLFKNCLEGELREIADRTKKLPAGKRWDTDPLFTGMTEDLFRDRDPTDEELEAAQKEGKKNLRAEIHAWRKKGFNFDDARIAFERGWNARTDNISDKNYNDPDNTGLFIMFDGTRVNPITTNKTEEHELTTEFDLGRHFAEQIRRARTMRNSEDDLETLRNQIAFLNSFATAEDGPRRNIWNLIGARECEEVLEDLRQRERYLIRDAEVRRWREAFGNRNLANRWRNNTRLNLEEAQTAQRNGWHPEQITERMAHLDGTDYNPLEITAETAERWNTTFLAPGTRNQWIATGLTFEQCQTAKNNGWIIDFIVRPIDLANPLAELRMTARPGETPLTFPITIRLKDAVDEAYERLFFADRGIADNEIKNRWIDLGLSIHEAIQAYDEKHWDNLEGVGRNEDNKIIYESHEQTTMIDLRGLWICNKNDLDTVHSLLNDIKRETDSSNLMYRITRTVGQRIANFDIADDALPEGARKANIEHARNIKSLTLNGWGKTLEGTIKFDDGSHLQPARDGDNIYLVNYTSSRGITINNIDIRLHGKTQIDNAHRILTDIRGKTIDSIDDLNDRGVIHTQIEAISAADNEKLPNELKKTALNRKRTERRNEINNEYAEWNRFFADHVAEFGRDAPTHEQNALRQSWRNSNLSPTRHAGADSEADQVWTNGWRDFNDNGTLGDVDNKGGRVSGFNRLTGTFVYTSYGIPTNGVDPKLKTEMI
ncbi:NADAR family protein [endosymbiont GvMRE of Glomus versiforme]|uniref:NADAR family protein n=1 Tax=endosymbiont GvMRE of Glomus versiforme TaxID=2039283 RepID=UPI000EE97BD1|nr:NADAR family protein [endosymbiont GvMRE of Glomus versiforme]RHZ36977.1 YbiA-like swarming motility protein [endosymbiont GvMRE of Glomus versiforme]